jgi:PKD repeat protein
MTRSLFILSAIFLFVSAGVSQDTLFLKPGPEEGKDAWICTHYTSINWGHHKDLSCCAWTSGGVPGVTRGLIEFDLSVIPENAIILKARLSLYANTTTNQSHIHSNLSGHNDGFISRVIDPWNEKTVLWGNQPSFDPDNQGYLHESNYEWEDYPDIEITELIRDSYNDPENSHGMLIHLRTEIYYRALVFCSSDHENPDKWPELEVVYEICEPPSAVFDYSADDHTVSFNSQDTSITEWLWDFGDGFLSTLQNPSHVFEGYGTYFVCLSATNECGTSEYCDSITVCNECSAFFEFETDEMEVTFSNLSDNWDDLVWDFGNGFSSIVGSPVYTFNIPGDHLVCLNVWNGCSEHTFCDTVSVFSSQGMNDPVNNGNPIAYPNPFDENLSVLLSDRPINEISIVDLAGKTLLCESFDNQTKVTLKTGFIPPGLYILTARSERRVYRQKILKRN